MVSSILRYMNQRSSNSLSIAIVLAALIIGGSIYMVFKPAPQIDPLDDPIGAAGGIASVTERDHVLGNPNAPIVIVEYTDLECPYCRNFHHTMKFLMDDYGKQGKIAWVVRHLPVPQLHPKAPYIHHAAECAAEQGGDEAFFAYIDKVFDRTLPTEGLDLEFVPAIAGEIGLNKDAFTICLESGKYKEYITDQAAEAYLAGAQGTPHSVVFFENQRLPVPGAQSSKTMRSLIDTLLARKNGQNQALPPLNI